MDGKKDTVLAMGMYANALKPGAPDFVIAKFGIKMDETDWLGNASKDAKKNGKEYLNFDILTSKKTGKPYIALDTWEPKPKSDDFEDDAPF